MIAVKPRLLVFSLAALALTQCAGWQSALDAQGEPAQQLQKLIILIVAVCAVVWIVVSAVLLRALTRRRESGGAPLTLDASQERRMLIFVVGGVAATVVIITAFTLASFFTTRSLAVASAADLTIRVRGLQWWWEAEYPGSGPGDSFKTANEFHVPVGRNVRVELEGVDVIHSFWVPSLAGKQDLIPGRPNEIVIRAERPGIYRGQCAEFCGMQHAHMAFTVIADAQQEFEAWTVKQREPAEQSASDAEIENGKRIFLSKPCAVCHAIRGTSANGSTGPDLTHVASRQYIGAGLFPTTRGSLAAWIADPQTLKPGNNMPMVPLSAEELQSVSAYMASLK